MLYAQPRLRHAHRSRHYDQGHQVAYLENALTGFVEVFWIDDVLARLYREADEPYAKAPW